jgi:predicted transcriptional regulator
MKKYKDKIKQKGLKKKWLAVQLGISASALSMYLNEIRSIPKDIELRLKYLLS